MPSIRSKLWPEDPYLGFDADRYPTDPQGWGSQHPFFETILRALKPASIIEVGTWKGASAIHMARLAKHLGFPTEILCVDTWLGSPEHILNQWQGWRASLKYLNGYPQLYYTFLSNVVANGFQDVITPFASTSENAAVLLARVDVKADLIYIDAAHEYEPALRDMKAFWPLLNDDGIMILDDYAYCDVTTAALNFAVSVDRPLFGSWGKAFISKKKDRVFTLTLDAVKA